MALAVPLSTMRQPVEAGQTRPLAWRLEQLQRLERLLDQLLQPALQALAADLGKPELEASFEVLAVRGELKHARRHLRRWLAPQRQPVDLALLPATAWVQAEPLGCVLIIGPWNYPLQLCLRPLVTALAAGNTVVIKPSELAPHSAALLAQVVAEHFDPEVVQVVQGDATTAQALLRERFDHILFTGGERVGRLVMAAAAEQLTPVTLELGGKSPAVVLADADLEVSARRLAWGRSLNAGQTCIAPDHVLVEQSQRDGLVAAMGTSLRRFYGDDPLRSSDLGRIINDDHYRRLTQLLEQARQRGQVLHGGRCDPEQRRIEPTLLAVQSDDDPLMQEELFGPLLPVLAVPDLNGAIASIRRRAKPLAIYLFSPSRQAAAELERRTSSGALVINDVVVQGMSCDLPFGGVGASGFGRYHGHAGFRCFSNERSLMRRGFRFDLPLRYPPYAGKLSLVQRLLG
jgi:aldehyde dehydrogenase (NAD+)